MSKQTLKEIALDRGLLYCNDSTAILGYSGWFSEDENGVYKGETAKGGFSHS